MEENYAIMIADLSGYSAMTETHGSLTAADLIDKYVAVVSQALVGDSYLHERVGDEVMILAKTPDHLLATAEKLSNRLAQENHFLQVHAALHYGKLLKRGSGYFGSALNVTSRIASVTSPGSISCSTAFLQTIDGNSVANFESIGEKTFKNITVPLEIFTHRKEDKPSFVIDPVCRMIVSANSHFFSTPGDSVHRFCSQECLDTYVKHGLRKRITTAAPYDS